MQLFLIQHGLSLSKEENPQRPLSEKEQGKFITQINNLEEN